MYIRKSLKITKGSSAAVNQRGTNNIMGKEEGQKLYRTLKIEQHEWQ